MAILFTIYLVCLMLIFFNKSRVAFVLVIINLILSLAMLMHHATDILHIRL